MHLPSIPLGLFRHPRARGEHEKVASDPPARAALLTKLQSKRDGANVSPSPLLVFFVGVLLALALAARFSAPTWDPFFPEALHFILRISLQSLWDPVGEDVKLTDVLESERLCVRLRLSFIDQVLGSGGSVLVRGGRGLPLLHLDLVCKGDEAVECWPQGDVVQSRLHFKPHSLAD